MKAWLESLKEGDEVMLPGRYGASPSFAKVTKITPTQIVIGRDRFKRTNGRQVGRDAWSSTCIVEPTQEGRDRHEMEALRVRLERYVKSPAATLEVLRAMRKVLQP
jgi:hypothetical protein